GGSSAVGLPAARCDRPATASAPAGAGDTRHNTETTARIVVRFLIDPAPFPRLLESGSERADTFDATVSYLDRVPLSRVPPVGTTPASVRRADRRRPLPP